MAQECPLARGALERNGSPEITRTPQGEGCAGRRCAGCNVDSNRREEEVGPRRGNDARTS